MQPTSADPAVASGETPLDLRAVLATALHAGQIMLENGASTARVEETVRRIGLALGAEHVEVFATPTGLFATHLAGGEHRTRIQRIARSEMDLSKIEAVLAISRAAEQHRINLAEVQQALEQASRAPRPFSLWVTPIASGIGCAASAVLLGGGLAEALATVVGAALGYLLAILLGRIGLSRIMSTAIAAAAATGSALAVALLLAAPFPALAMSAAILMLTPGVLIVSAVSDLFRGDTLSGVARAAMALLAVAGIAAGSWFVIALSGASLAIGSLAPPDWLNSVGLAAITTIAFAMLFGVQPRRVVPAALAGMAGYAATRFTEQLGAPPGVAIFMGGLAVGLLAELLARLLRTPATTFSIPGIITLVPGGIAFRTMLAYAQSDIAAGTTDLVRTVLLAGALAAGLGTITGLVAIRLRRGNDPATQD